MRYTTCLFRPLRTTTKTTRCRRPRSTCRVLQHARARKAPQDQDHAGLDLGGLRQPFEHPQKESYWGETSNPIGPRSCYDEGSAARKPFSSTIIASTGSISRWPESLTPTAPGCTQTTAVWCRTSSCRRLRAAHNHLRRRPADALLCYVDDLVEGFVKLMCTPDGFLRDR